jgi:hypothetical protein
MYGITNIINVNSTKLPSDWDKHNDQTGKRYYSNIKTNQSSWTPPEGATGGSTGK